MRKNQIFYYILATLLAISTAIIATTPKGQAAGPITAVELTASSSAITEGEDFWLYVNIADVQNLYSCQISLKYDSSIIEYQDVSEGTFLNNNLSQQTFRINPIIEPGTIKGYAISRVGNVSGVSGSGRLASFRFRAIKPNVNTSIYVWTDDSQGTKLLNNTLAAIYYNPSDTSINTIASTNTDAQDTIAPYIKNLTPIKNAIDVKRDTKISFEIVDMGSGVDPQSIILKINNYKATPTINADGKNYSVAYQPTTIFDYGQMVNISINAQDLGSPANIMPQENYSFIIEPAPDTTAPVISKISISDITSHSATISWQTNESTDSQINYGLQKNPSNLNTETKIDQFSKQHSITIDNLLENTIYEFAIISHDYQNNVAQSTIRNFQTYIASGIPATTPTANSADTLYKGSGPNIYLIRANTTIKNLVPSAQIFESHGWRWSKIIQTTDILLANYTEGPSISTGRQGQIVKGSGSTIYYIDQDRKQPFASAASFLSQGFAWKNIVQIDDAELNQFEQGTDRSIIFKNGRALVKTTNNPLIWLIENNLIRYIASAEIFNSYKFNWNDIQTIEYDEKNSYVGCWLIKLSDSPDIFFKASLGVDGNFKQRISSVEVFNNHKFQWDKIITVNQLEFDSYEQREYLF